MPNSDMVAYRWSLCEVSKADLKSTKKCCDSICCFYVFSKIWHSEKIWSMVVYSGFEPISVLTNAFNLSHIALLEYWAEQTSTAITWHAFQWTNVAEKVVQAANQLISSCIKKFSREVCARHGFLTHVVHLSPNDQYGSWYWGQAIAKPPSGYCGAAIWC